MNKDQSNFFILVASGYSWSFGPDGTYYDMAETSWSIAQIATDNNRPIPKTLWTLSCYTGYNDFKQDIFIQNQFYDFMFKKTIQEKQRL